MAYKHLPICGVGSIVKYEVLGGSGQKGEGKVTAVHIRYDTGVLLTLDQPGTCTEFKTINQVHVTEIVEQCNTIFHKKDLRDPSVMKRMATNKKGIVCCLGLDELVVHILGNKFPMGEKYLAGRKLWELWEKDAKRGLVYIDSPNDTFKVHYIRYKTFKKWVLKNYLRFLISYKDMAKIAREQAKEYERDYWKSVEEEWKRDMGQDDDYFDDPVNLEKYTSGECEL